jgi:chromate transporter
MTDVPITAVPRAEHRHGVSLAEAFRVWLRVATLSFGGPAGQIAVMHRIIVDEKRWVGENRFLHALSYCMLLPGPEAHQLAIYIGWLMHRWPGAIIAGGLFVLPGIVSIMALSYVYAAFGSVPVIACSSDSKRRCSPLYCMPCSGSAAVRSKAGRCWCWRRLPSSASSFWQFHFLSS